MTNPFELIEKRLDKIEDILFSLKQLAHEKSTDNHSPGLKTQKEVLSELKISLTTLIEWRKKGFIKAHRIGSRIFYKEEEIRAALIEKHNL